jgi:DNA invertase Pin-like site-specific DNA recombinase
LQQTHLSRVEKNCINQHAQILAKKKIRISRKDLVNWLIERFAENLSGNELNALIDRFYDEERFLFEKVDRLARDMIYNLGLLKKAQEYGVEVFEFESGKIDLRDRGSRLGFNIKNMLSEEYSLDLEEKITKKQREARINNGKDTSTFPALGLDPHPAKRGMYLINKKEQEVVTDIFKKFIELGSIKGLADYCRERGYKTKVRITKEKSDREGNIIPPKKVGSIDV